MRWKHVNGYGALTLSLALLLPAASALAQVVNRSFTITDSTEPDTTGIANFTGAINSGTAQTICRNGSNTVTVSGATTHPEFVRLVRNTGTLQQGGVGNLPTVRMIGAGAQVFNVVLACNTAALKSLVNNASNVSAGTFQVQAGSCTGLTQAQATYLNDTCLADVNNTTIKLGINGATVEKLMLIGAGTAL